MCDFIVSSGGESTISVVFWQSEMQEGKAVSI